MDGSTQQAPAPRLRALIVGAGPAGLMAAEALLAAGAQVDLHDAMPSSGRKFLLAGKGGLNLTHAEPRAAFEARYGERAGEVARWLDRLDAEGLRAWAKGLGIETFVGSSGKVFPAEMKAAPLLRAWLHRLRGAGLRLHMRQRWNGTLRRSDGGWRIGLDTPAGPVTAEADVLLFALGGASWPRLGSDGAWQPWLQALGVPLAPLVSANCGFEVDWSEHLKGRFAGEPLKGVRLLHVDRAGRRFDRAGEAVVSAYGIEGALVYAASAQLRDEIAASGPTAVALDLLPQRSEA
ncbi:MAG TPA: TIGR03862 family flavoprotein, partial [Burkholderiaceae bacterium]|nr:TIGR03862 family flavoprotein [Burkholderiaceae bacterium]